ncbi:MAG: hypothetical protein ACXAEU_05145 [Candidatus Hodarchaeales archaeon]|jgi:transcription initiation factor TFIIIB Brf1 subunit/transcription initiation factor TFIIB
MDGNEKCHECGGYIIKTLSDYVCSSCGLVYSAELIARDASSVNSRFTQSLNYQGDRPNMVDGIGTYIGHYGNWKLKDAQGKSINGSNKLSRLKKINDYYIHNSSNELNYRAFRLLNSICGVLELPWQVKIDAARIIRKSSGKLPSKVRMADMVSASIYMSTRLSSYNLRTSKLLEAFEKESITIRGKQMLFAAYCIKSLIGFSLKPCKSEDYLESVLSKIQNDQEVTKRLKTKNVKPDQYIILLRRISRFLLTKIPPHSRGGRNPYALAGATVAGADTIIARINNQKRGLITQKKIARLSDIAEYTLREHYLVIVKPVVQKIIEKQFNSDYFVKLRQTMSIDYR